MKTLKTLLLLSIVSLTAAQAEQCAPNNTGFQVGLTGGMANTYSKYNYQNVNPTQFTSSSYSPNGGLVTVQQAGQNTTMQSGKVGGVFGLFAGYGMSFGGGAYVGGEVYGALQTTKFSPFDDSKTGNFSGYWKTQVKKKNFIGASIRLGYNITSTVLTYVRLGLERGSWQFTVTPRTDVIDARSTAATADQVTAAKKVAKKTKHSLNFVPGLGAEVYLNKNVFVRAEYNYVFAPKAKLRTDVRAFSGQLISGDFIDHKFKNHEHRATLSVGYKF